MDVPHWSPAEIRDFARGHEISYGGANLVDRPFPAWLDEVVSGRSPYSPAGAMAIAHPDDHAAMIASFFAGRDQPDRSAVWPPTAVRSRRGRPETGPALSATGSQADGGCVRATMRPLPG
jgi:hypothetical protein